MGEATYKPSSAGFKEMAVGDEIRAVVLEIAEKAKVEAEALSADFAVTGEYLSAFEVRSDTVDLHTGFGSHPVAAGILQNNSDHAAAVEYGNKNDHRPHRVFGRVLDALSHL